MPSYKKTLTDSVDSNAGVPASRRIDTVAPLEGGGDLTSNRTISIDPSALVPTIDLQPGANIQIQPLPLVGSGSIGLAPSIRIQSANIGVPSVTELIFTRGQGLYGHKDGGSLLGILGGFNFVQVGSGFLHGTIQFQSFEAGNAVLFFDIPAYAASVAGANRYVTSGEMAAAGGATPPGGSDTQVQFNDGGNFGGDPALLWNKAADRLTVSGQSLLYGPAYQGTITGPARYVTSGELSSAAGSAQGNNGAIQYNAGTSSFSFFGAEDALRWDAVGNVLTVSGAAHIGDSAALKVQEFFGVGTDAIGYGWRLTGSGNIIGSADWEPRLQTDVVNVNLPLLILPAFVPGYVPALDIPSSSSNVRFGGNLQISGLTLHYGPVYQGQFIPAQRYVTSGELVGITATQPGGGASSIQYNASGAFAGDAKLTWLWQRSPPLFGIGGALEVLGALQVSGTSLVYGPIYQGSLVDPTLRYVTSGELNAATAPAGSNFQIQYNNAGAFGADSHLVWFRPVNILLVSGTLFARGGRIGFNPQQLAPPAFGELHFHDTSGVDRLAVTAASILFDSTGGIGFAPDISSPADLTLSRGGLSQFIIGDGTVVPAGLLTGTLQVSGGSTLLYAPAYQGRVNASAQRYVTSGELAGAPGIPAGPFAAIQFDNAGTFGGDARLAWDTTPAAPRLLVSGAVNVLGRMLVSGTARLGGLVVADNPQNEIDVGTAGEAHFWSAGYQVAELTAGGMFLASGLVIGFSGKSSTSPDDVELQRIGKAGLAVIDPTQVGTVPGGFLTGTLQVSGQVLGYDSANLRGLVTIGNLNDPRGLYQQLAGSGLTFNLRNWELNGTGVIEGPIDIISQHLTDQLTITNLITIFRGSDIQVSGGTLLLYQPAYQGKIGNAAQRYVTSGELAGAPGLPAGSNTQLQFNNGGVFGATAIVGSGGVTWEGGQNLVISGGASLTLVDTTGSNLATLNSQGVVLGKDTSLYWFDHTLGALGSLDLRLLRVGQSALKIGRAASLGVGTLTVGDTQISGTLLTYQPAYQGTQTAAQRYVTSGELSAATSSAALSALTAATAANTITNSGYGQTWQWNTANANEFGLALEATGANSLATGQRLLVLKRGSVDNAQVLSITAHAPGTAAGQKPLLYVDTQDAVASNANPVFRIDAQGRSFSYINSPVAWDNSTDNGLGTIAHLHVLSDIGSNTASGVGNSSARNFATIAAQADQGLASVNWTGTQAAFYGLVRTNTGALSFNTLVGGDFVFMATSGAPGPVNTAAALRTQLVGGRGAATGSLILVATGVGLLIQPISYPNGVDITTPLAIWAQGPEASLFGGPLYQGALTSVGAARYLTSGELSTSATPASPPNAVQYNNAGAFGGDATLTWDTAAKNLTVSGFLGIRGIAVGSEPTRGGAPNVGAVELRSTLGVVQSSLSAGTILQGNAGAVGWGPNAAVGSTDVVLVRQGVGVVKVADSGFINPADLSIRNLQVSGTALTYGKTQLVGDLQASGAHVVSYGNLEQRGQITIGRGGTVFVSDTVQQDFEQVCGVIVWGGGPGFTGIVPGTTPIVLSGTHAQFTGFSVQGPVTYYNPHPLTLFCTLANEGLFSPGDPNDSGGGGILSFIDIPTYLASGTTLFYQTVFANPTIGASAPGAPLALTLHRAFGSGLTLSGVPGGGLTTILQRQDYVAHDTTGVGTVNRHVGFLAEALTQSLQPWAFGSDGLTTPSYHGGPLILGVSGTYTPGALLHLVGSGVRARPTLLISGGGFSLTYDPIYSTTLTPAGRYVTSGELSGMIALPYGGIQYNASGVQAADAGLTWQWQRSPEILTVSGAHLNYGDVQILGNLQASGVSNILYAGAELRAPVVLLRGGQVFSNDTLQPSESAYTALTAVMVDGVTAPIVVSGTNATFGAVRLAGPITYYAPNLLGVGPLFVHFATWSPASVATPAPNMTTFSDNPTINASGTMGSYISFSAAPTIQPARAGSNLTTASLVGFRSGATLKQSPGILATTSRAGFVHAKAAVTGAVAITADVALDIADTTQSAVTNAYSVRSAGGGVAMLHAGNVRLGDNAAPSNLLDLRGAFVVTSGGVVTQYGGFPTVSNGLPSEYATVDTAGLTANVASAVLYAVSGAGMFRVSSYVVETTAASVSSTLPNVQILYTDKDTGGAITIDATPILGIAGIGQTGALTANTVGTASAGVICINAKASTNINYQTVNYASSLAGMAYALHIKLEAL